MAGQVEGPRGPAPALPPPLILSKKKYNNNRRRKKSRQGKRQKTGPPSAQGLDPQLANCGSSFLISLGQEPINGILV